MPLTRPTTTPLPDEIYDVWAPRLGAAELKVLLYIVRRTLGFRKPADAISLSQFLHGVVTRDGRVLDHGCGVASRRSLVAALKSLEEHGLIRTLKAETSAGDHDITTYALWWDDEVAGGSSRKIPPGSPRIPRWYPQDAEVVAGGHQGSSPGIPTTNSIPTNSQQDSEATRAPARDDTAHDKPLLKQRDTSEAAATALWQAVLTELRSIVTLENYATWLAPTAAQTFQDSTLIVAVPTDFHGHWLGTRLRGRVEAALRRLGYAGVQVTYVAAA